MNEYDGFGWNSDDHADYLEDGYTEEYGRERGWPNHGYGCPCGRCARTHAPVRPPAPTSHPSELSFQDIAALRGPQLQEIQALPETWECPASEGGVWDD